MLSSAFGKGPKNYGDVEFWHTPERTGWLMKQGEADVSSLAGPCSRPALHAYSERGRRLTAPDKTNCDLAPKELWRHSPCMPTAGEYIKTWRRRWFILKQGRIFWFKTEYVTPVRGFCAHMALSNLHGC